MAMILAWALLFSISGYQVCSGRVNVPGTCPVSGYGCLQCLSRGSSNLERCYQQYIFLRETTSNNEMERDRYCTGDCPIIVATAYYYCRDTSNIASLFNVCGSYSVTPTGSFNVNANYSKQHCLDRYQSQRCSHCIGQSNRDAVKCLQMFLLAKYTNNTAFYAQSYCSSDCPVTLWTTSWHCGLVDQSDAYQICRRFGATYCAEFDKNSRTDLQQAVTDCRRSCISQACEDAKLRFGCCMRSNQFGLLCTDIPECPIHAMAATPTLNINGDCPFNSHGCSQCLSRNSDQLLRCEQLRLIIAQFVNHDQEETEFCASQCPTLLISSRDYCSEFNRATEMTNIMNLCPTYDVMPTTSVVIRANFSRQNCLSNSRQSCSDCILSRSGDLTMCYQQYLLSQYANVSQTYSKSFCASNCPLRLATSNWYCNIGTTSSLFSTCLRRDSDTFCAPLTRDNGNEFAAAATACRSDCSSQLCNSGKRRFGCCLRSSLSSSICPEISSCILETSSASRLFSATNLFLILTVSSLQYL